MNPYAIVKYALLYVFFRIIGILLFFLCGCVLLLLVSNVAITNIDKVSKIIAFESFTLYNLLLSMVIFRQQIHKFNEFSPRFHVVIIAAIQTATPMIPTNILPIFCLLLAYSCYVNNLERLRLMFQKCLYTFEYFGLLISLLEWFIIGKLMM